MTDSKKPMSLSEQLKIQQMYSNNIKNTKTERQLVEDELVLTKRQLDQATKKPIIKNDKS